jgi:hypothetical protein
VIRIYGIDEDRVYIEPSWGKSEEVHCLNREVIININDELNLCFGYEGPSWYFKVFPEKENIEDLPEILVVPESNYSFAIEVDYPDGTEYFWELN